MSYKKRNHKTSLILNTLPFGQGVQYGESAQHNRFFRILSSCLRSVGATKRNISLQVIVLRWEGHSCLWPSHTLDAATPACFGVKNLISFWASVRKFRHFYFLSHIDWHQNNFHSAWTCEHEDHSRYLHPSDSGHWQICCRDARGNMTIAKK